MDERCVFLFLSIFIINFLSVTNEGKKLYIKDTLKVKPFDDRLEPKKLQTVVVDALTARYKNRKMIDVSKNRFKFHMVWRGFKRFLMETILKVFCPSIVRDLRSIKLLREMVSNDDVVRNKLNFVLPFDNSKSTKKGNNKDENSDEDSDKESDDENDKESNESKKRNKKPVIKGKNSKTEKNSEEDDDDDSDEDDSIEEEESNPKKRKKTLDDLFK
ncbi:acidic leucine-rich nuclear phosphoprotein 32 family member B-like [Rhopalosiphum maidis]|uniref:acidic leucine-rich nuclear phosphoprotein 32 family member B-like n=1 Tax=Rhopalosiphum maidis TaxID=43146 RepID=UPI000EFFB76C|nr:acidic leucine-rich nuclear phosphoprotein 32 family member B-like [Rhopalosiphum maidis]